MAALSGRRKSTQQWSPGSLREREREERERGELCMVTLSYPTRASLFFFVVLGVVDLFDMHLLCSYTL